MTDFVTREQRPGTPLPSRRQVLVAACAGARDPRYQAGIVLRLIARGRARKQTALRVGGREQRLYLTGVAGYDLLMAREAAHTREDVSATRERES